MRHLDLFSGIGGFALATEMVFGKENVEHIFCDNDPFSQAILKKHWPNAPIYDDIKTLTADKIERDSARGWYCVCQWFNSKRNTACVRCHRPLTDAKSFQAHVTEQGRLYAESGGPYRGGWNGIDILTGGFPCQPFSSAGRRAGTEDDRHLWPEMLRVIRETNPTYVLGENVGGLLTWDGGLVLEMVLADLEAAGYEAGAFVVPAAAVGAPHRRDRVWIAAHAVGRNAGRAPGFVRGSEESEGIPKRDEVGEPGEPSEVRDGRHDAGPSQSHQQGSQGRELDQASDDRPTHKPTSELHKNLRQWLEDWPQVAARLCTLDDGLPDGLARPRGWRNAALKGAGNAIVPQVAAEIIRAMML